MYFAGSARVIAPGGVVSRLAAREPFVAPSHLTYRRGGSSHVASENGAVTAVDLSQHRLLQVGSGCLPDARRHDCVGRDASDSVMSLIAWTWSCVRPYRGRMAMLSFIAAANIALGLLRHGRLSWSLTTSSETSRGRRPSRRSNTIWPGAARSRCSSSSCSEASSSRY